ncbi:MAG: NUDIX domain-containing protein [Armatimonadota bacterium]
MKPIKNSAKAIIIQDGKLLCTKNQDSDGYYYLLPGGGQNPGETIVDALKRECMEEVSASVEVGDLIFIRELIGKNHEFAEDWRDMHVVDFIFTCTLISLHECVNGAALDDNQIGAEWLPIDRLHEYRLYPLSMRGMIRKIANKNTPVFLGDIN